MALNFSDVIKWLKEAEEFIKKLFNKNSKPPAGTAQIDIQLNNGPIIIGNNNTVSYKLVNDKSCIPSNLDTTIIHSFKKEVDGIPLWLFLESDTSKEYACIGVYISCSFNEKKVFLWLGCSINVSEKKLEIDVLGTRKPAQIEAYDPEAVLKKLAEILKKQFELPS
ncbi:hypothetical protein ACYULU_15180 [Breznakiellaceae bacterium SP9]